MQSKDYWFPWYPVRFRRKTIALPRECRHAYRDLIDWYMETDEPLPNNPVALASIAGMDIDSWSQASAKIMTFFTVEKDGLLHNETCDEILADQQRRSRSYAERGRKGAEKKWEEQSLNGDSHEAAIAKPMANDSTRQDKTVHNKLAGADKTTISICTDALARPAKPGQSEWNPDRHDGEVLPGGWDEEAQKAGLMNGRVYESWARFKDRSDRPFERKRWVGWLSVERRS